MLKEWIMRKGLAITFMVSWGWGIVACGGSPATVLPSPVATQRPVTPTRTEQTNDSPKVEMVFVPAGEFPMGSDVGDADERPVHSVYLDAYYIDRYEVTNARYRLCVQAEVCLPPANNASFTRASYYDNPDFDDFPVIYVSWEMAQTYCAWRGTQLPTEAQWEKAARGTDGRTFAWGEDIDCQWTNYLRQDDQNFVACIGDTSRVGSYENGRSPYGAYDMTGNVWEWVADWYGNIYYQNSPASNPKQCKSP